MICRFRVSWHKLLKHHVYVQNNPRIPIPVRRTLRPCAAGANQPDDFSRSLVDKMAGLRNWYRLGHQLAESDSSPDCGWRRGRPCGLLPQTLAGSGRLGRTTHSRGKCNRKATVTGFVAGNTTLNYRGAQVGVVKQRKVPSCGARAWPQDVHRAPQPGFRASKVLRMNYPRFPEDKLARFW
jgi:hypothetical protein